MADYTHTNIDELDDTAPKFGLGDVHEARFATKPLGCTQLGLAHYRVKPNQRTPFGHKHGSQEEIYVILAGSGRMQLGEETVGFRAGDLFRVAPETVRTWEAGSDGAEIIAVGARVTAGGENDAELVEDAWRE
jgi:mannose-6-phosphate isomerase-like protein (cupin superfamily)